MKSTNKSQYVFCEWLFIIAYLLTTCDCFSTIGKNNDSTIVPSPNFGIIKSSPHKANLTVFSIPLLTSSSNLHSDTEKETEKETVIDEKQNSIEKLDNIALGHHFGLGFGGLKSNPLLALLLLTSGGKHLANNQLLTLLLLLQSSGGLHDFHHLFNPLALGKFGHGKFGLNPLLALGLTGGLGTFGGLGLGGHNPLLLLLLAQALNHKKDDKDDKNYHMIHPDYYKMPTSQFDVPVNHYDVSSDRHIKTTDNNLTPALYLPNHYNYKDQNYPADTYQINQYSKENLLKKQILNTDLLAKFYQTSTSAPKTVTKLPPLKISSKSIKLLSKKS